MGEALCDSEPVVRSVLDHCDQLPRQERHTSLLEVMFGQSPHLAILLEPAWASPAAFALEVALAAL